MRLKTPKPGRISAEDAETVAAEALRYLAGDGGQLVAFLRDSGMEPRHLAASAGERGTLVAVLEYVVRDESLLLSFSASAGHRPELVVAALQLLAGPMPESSL